MTHSLAIVGMSCRYADARSPDELWENVLSQRRAFRRIPAERLRLDDYFSADPATPDSIYSTEAALIEDFEFDRIRFRIAGNTFRSTDIAHWLALATAAQALTDAGFKEDRELPRETTGVFLGNTLTSEFSRANTLRLRWPYVRRVLDRALHQKQWTPAQRRDFLKQLEKDYKEPFHAVNEETLAGGLSNTIAGRICNHFDFKGGGYTLDGACASSLLAVSNACSALAANDLDLALAGGVDLSLDPFELVGFAKTGALAREQMRIYDVRSEGFWPGEGCGFVALMRYDDAVAQGRRIYATIQGWGISSDGSGGITRPEFEGQILALTRAYRRAGFDAATINYFEGHGTGTSVGDATELRVLSHAVRHAMNQEEGEGAHGSLPFASPAIAIGSIKANIGHTKAAAGVAGLIKAAMALHTQVLPPTTGCEEPHAELREANGDGSDNNGTGHRKPALRVLKEAEAWPAGRLRRAGVSAMGFGGINVHLALEGVGAERREQLGEREKMLTASAQDAELFLLSARDAVELGKEVEHLLTFAARLSRAEMADLAVALQKKLVAGEARVACVAGHPAELAARLETLRSWLAEGVALRLDCRAGIFLNTSVSSRPPRIGLLFPGQGAPFRLDGGAWSRRFPFARELYQQAALPAGGDEKSTAIAQPAIVVASMAGLQALDKFGVRARVAAGHSLGEITALHWAGALDKAALLRIAKGRGKAMSDLGAPDGWMASIAAGQDEVEALLNGDRVVIAGSNSPHQTVISGEAFAVSTIIARAQSNNLRAVRLPVSHAFHSPLMAATGPALAALIADEHFQLLQRRIISTVTGTLLAPDTDLRNLLLHQITSPVRFMEAARQVLEEVDLLIEVGSGQILTGLVEQLSTAVPVLALDAGGQSVGGLWRALGAAFALGESINYEELYRERFSRPFNLDWRPRFFINPCETISPLEDGAQIEVAEAVHVAEKETADAATHEQREEADNLGGTQDVSPTTPLRDLVRQLVAERTELPLEAIKDEDRLLGDLHLNSIAVSQLVAEAARKIDLPAPLSPTDYANVTVADLTRTLNEIKSLNLSAATQTRYPSGVDSWIRPFTIELVERPLSQRHRPAAKGEAWKFVAPDDYPLTSELRKALGSSPGQEEVLAGVVVCLPIEPDESCLDLLLEGARLALAGGGATRFVLVQTGGGGGAASFARTLHLEHPEISASVVNVPLNHAAAVEWICAEAQNASGYREAHYDESGTRREPVLRLLPLPETATAGLPLNAEDVLLVTGGGKGIAAECALSLARATGVKLVIVGRSSPAKDTELSTNLERMREAGIRVKYAVADVTEADVLKAAIREAEKEFGPVTAIIHSAGANVPQLLETLDKTAFLRTLAPKVEGARNLLAAINPQDLRLFITFGSLIARTGMRGEAHYAVANEWLTRLAERWQAEHPGCRCLAVEWSVWSGVGMGERLGTVELLRQQGITPVPVDEGISLLSRMLEEPTLHGAVVVTGRFGEPPTLQVEKPELPFWRFLEETRVYYPGLELVVDAELSADNDLYLDDHVFQGNRLFPAVMGLEAMAQAAMGLMQTSEPPVFENVRFSRPVAGGKAPTKIRVAALVRAPGRVEVALRSEETGFQVDHFHAVCNFKDAPAAAAAATLEAAHPYEQEAVLPPLPAVNLYGELLFQGGRFQRLKSYRRLAAREAVAEIEPDGKAQWFSLYLPSTLVLGDAGARDAIIHAIQACVPQATILPTGVERLSPGTAKVSGPLLARARERSHIGAAFTYDVEVTDAAGHLYERWEGLQLQIVAAPKLKREWIELLLGPYLERRVKELIGGAKISVAVERNGAAERNRRTERAIQRALGEMVCVRRRADGRPEVAGAQAVSASHLDDLTMAVAGGSPLACDIEKVTARPQPVWKDLIGDERFRLAKLLCDEADESFDDAATRVWAAGECLQKAGATEGTPLLFDGARDDGWLLLTAGELSLATYTTTVRNTTGKVVLAVCLKGEVS